MIRELIESGYERMLGVLKGVFGSLFSPILRRGNLLSVVYMLIMVGLMGGFVSALAFPVPNQGQLVFPSRGAQSIPEAILDSFVIVLGGAGIYLTYVSGRQTTRARAVSMYLGLAFLLLAISLLAGTRLLQLK